MKPSEEVHHLAKWFRQLGFLYDAAEANDRRLKAVDRLREEAISFLKPITPPDADLKNLDYVPVFCFEMLRTPGHELYGDALRLLRMCTLYLERGRVEQSDIQEILLLYAGSNKAEETKTIISNRASKAGKTGGSKPKQLQGIKAAVTRILKSGKHDFSAERLWRYFEKNHSGRKNDFKVNNYRMFFGYSKKDEDEERLFQISPDKTIQSIGRSAFAGYIKSAKEKLK